MKTVIAASEAAPFAKTGGLADVAGSLPKFINRQVSDVVLMLPLYRSIDREFFGLNYMGPLTVPYGGENVQASLFSGLIPGSGVSVFFLHHPQYYGRKGIYQENGMDYGDNDDRYAFFCRGVLEMCRKLNYRPDVIHCNDWQTGLIPAYLKTVLKDDPFFREVSTLFTIHNLSFHGLFPPERVIERCGLPWNVFDMYGAEFNGMFSFLKSGLFYSDLINTVSETYSREIQQEESGEGLHGLLRDRSNSLSGIVNGVDYSIWNPESDTLIAENYGPQNIEKKETNKRRLCETCGLDYSENLPLIGMTTRLTGQKGIDLVSEILPALTGTGARFVLLGTGEVEYHRIFSEYAGKYRGLVHVSLEYNDTLSHMIYAGSDIFLMPSRFEPCGLSQLISLKYGTIPLARETGGLADTIQNFRNEGGTVGGNGFSFREYSGRALMTCIEGALEVFRNKKLWRGLMLNAMECDFSWGVSSEKYEKLYLLSGGNL